MVGGDQGVVPGVLGLWIPVAASLLSGSGVYHLSHLPDTGPGNKTSFLFCSLGVQLPADRSLLSIEYRHPYTHNYPGVWSIPKLPGFHADILDPDHFNLFMEGFIPGNNPAPGRKSKFSSDDSGLHPAGSDRRGILVGNFRSGMVEDTVYLRDGRVCESIQ